MAIRSNRTQSLTYLWSPRCKITKIKGLQNQGLNQAFCSFFLPNDALFCLFIKYKYLNLFRIEIKSKYWIQNVVHYRFANIFAINRSNYVALNESCKYILFFLYLCVGGGVRSTNKLTCSQLEQTFSILQFFQTEN